MKYDDNTNNVTRNQPINTVFITDS